MQTNIQETQFQLMGKGPLILVPSYLNNTGPHNFILDSGATHCLIVSFRQFCMTRPDDERYPGACPLKREQYRKTYSNSVKELRRGEAHIRLDPGYQRACGQRQPRWHDDMACIALPKHYA